MEHREAAANHSFSVAEQVVCNADAWLVVEERGDEARGWDVMVNSVIEEPWIAITGAISGCIESGRRI